MSQLVLIEEPYECDTEEQYQDALMHAEALNADGAARPKTRGDCVGGCRPCPWVTCEHHLHIDAVTPLGTLKTVGSDPTQMRESCSLDVADRGAHSLESIGAILGLTRERIRQVEQVALGKMAKRAGVLAPFAGQPEPEAPFKIDVFAAARVMRADGWAWSRIARTFTEKGAEPFGSAWRPKDIAREFRRRGFVDTITPITDMVPGIERTFIALAESAPCFQRDICGRLAMSPSTVSKYVNELIAANRVRRRAGPGSQKYEVVA